MAGTLAEQETMVSCDNCDDNYPDTLDQFAKGPDGQCAPCRMEQVKKTEAAPEAVSMNGDRMISSLDTDLKEELRRNEFFTAYDAIAVLVFRAYPSATQATVVYDGKQTTVYRDDFEDVAYDHLPLETEPERQKWAEKREKCLRVMGEN